MGFGEAIQSGFRRYVDFAGRSSRSEFWFWVLFAFIAQIVAGIIDAIVLGMGILGGLVALALLLPGLAVSVRRLHDIGRTGWWVLIGLVPVVGLIVLIVFYVKPGQPGPNRFGANPLETHGLGNPAMA